MASIATLFESGEQARNRGHYYNMLMLARMDGVVTDAEQNLLNRIADKLSLTNDQVKEIMSDEDSYPMQPPVSREERYERFIQLIQVCMIDGALSHEESNLVKKYGITLGFTSERINEKFPVILQKLQNGKSREEVIESIL